MKELIITSQEGTYYEFWKTRDIEHVKSPKDLNFLKETIADKFIFLDLKETAQELIIKRVGIEKCFLGKNIDDKIIIQEYPIDGVFRIKDDLEQIERFFKGELDQKIYNVSFPNLSEYYKIGMGELTIVTGTPSSGKSTFVDCMLLDLAENHNLKFAICSFETQKIKHWSRFIQRVGRDYTKHVKRPLEAIEFIQEHFYLIKKGLGGLTIDSILDLVDMAKRKYNIDGFVVDPYNWLEHKKKNGQSETEYIADLLTKIQNFVKDREMHCWFIAHPSKPDSSFRNKFEPMLYDISGSANWFNIADMGLTIHRPQNDLGERTSTTKVIVTKVRNSPECGKPGTAWFDYNMREGRYSSAPPPLNEGSNFGWKKN